MPQTNIQLQFADSLGRARVLHAVIGDGGSWHLRASVEGSTFTKYCDSWQAVERTLTWLRRHAHESGGATAPPRRRPGLVAAMTVLVMATGIGAAFAQSVDAPVQAVTAFENATHDYALMHRRLERQIGAIEFGTPVAEINRIIHELAAAIRAERADARQGDIFTPALGHVLRARINDALLEHRYTVGDVWAAAQVDGVDYQQVRLQVNGAFPWVLSTAMLPCVIEALPPLPPELQYRIVDDDLVLIDIHASLIVDVLPHALIDLTARQLWLQGGMR